MWRPRKPRKQQPRRRGTQRPLSQSQTRGGGRALLVLAPSAKSAKACHIQRSQPPDPLPASSKLPNAPDRSCPATRPHVTLNKAGGHTRVHARGHAHAVLLAHAHIRRDNSYGA